MRARLAAGLALAALAGCGGGDSPNEALSETAGNLKEIKSGTLALDVSAEGRGGGADASLGFELDGPFALPAEGRLPVAKLRYTQRSGDQRATATFISTGEQAFVEAGGKTRRLPGDEAERLRAATGEVSSSGGVRELRLDRWMREPKLDEGAEVGGDATDRIRAKLDVRRALADVGGSLVGNGKDLERAVKDARIEVLTGKDDRLLRRLTVDLELALEVPESLRRRLGRLVGGKLRLAFQISDPNRKVTVKAPQ